MKSTLRITSMLLMFITSSLFAQQDVRTIDMTKINALKKSGKLTGKEHFVNYAAKGLHPFKVTGGIVPHNATNGCDCWIERDSTWQIVSFDGSGGNGGPGVAPEFRNDDWSTNVITLPFNFSYYGDTINNIYINNNGNISMIDPYSDYTSFPFPNNLYEMIAPFWADVDTRDSLSGLVYYKLTPTSLIVQWENVGYFNIHSDLVNTFQLVITNNNDSIISDSNNVSFCYKDMQWTTGDASNGVGGFGGTPATVGVNKGNGIEYIQIGQFDQLGNAFDGPYGNNDGIDALDNQYFYFNISGAGTNIPPIINLPVGCDTITVMANDSLSMRVNFLSPEQNQTTTITYSAPGVNGLSVVNTPGNFASIELRAPGNSNSGFRIIHVYATDNGTPAATSTATLRVNFLGVTGINEINSTANGILFSNPVTNLCTITETTFSNATLSVYDVTGRVMIQQSFNSKTDLDVSKLSKGIYFVELKDKAGRSVKQKMEKQ